MEASSQARRGAELGVLRAGRLRKHAALHRHALRALAPLPRGHAPGMLRGPAASVLRPRDPDTSTASAIPSRAGSGLQLVAVLRVGPHEAAPALLLVAFPLRFGPRRFSRGAAALASPLVFSSGPQAPLSARGKARSSLKEAFYQKQSQAGRSQVQAARRGWGPGVIYGRAVRPHVSVDGLPSPHGTVQHGWMLAPPPAHLPVGAGGSPGHHFAALRGDFLLGGCAVGVGC